MVGTRGGRASLDRRLSRLSQLGSRVGYDLRPAADRLFSFRDLADDFSVATSRVSADDSLLKDERDVAADWRLRGEERGGSVRHH